MCARECVCVHVCVCGGGRYVGTYVDTYVHTYVSG